MAEPLTHPAVRLAGDGSAVSVSSSSDALLDWLCSFWQPWLEATSESEAGEPWLDVDTRAGSLERALDGAVATGLRAACFTLDNGAGEWTIFQTPEGEIAVDDTAMVALRVTAGERPHIRVIGCADQALVRSTVLRVVRELVTSQAHARGAFALHASAVAGADRAVTLFVGPKGAGKTTHLLLALARPGTALVANDRVLLRPEGVSFRVLGLPTIVALRTSTLELFPELQSEIESDRWHFAATAADGDAFRREQLALSLSLGRRRGISPAQLCTLVGRPAEAAGPLARIVFPCGEAASEPGRDATPLDRDAAVARILAGGLVAGGRNATYLPGTAQQSPAWLEEAVGSLVRAVPCFDAAAVAGVAQRVA